MNKLSEGKVQVYTGNGKGKTTAALGLMLRAAGAGMDIYFGQFMKAGDTSEAEALRRFLGHAVTMEQYGSGGEARTGNGTPPAPGRAMKRPGLPS